MRSAAWSQACAIAGQGLRIGDAFLGDHPFERREPVPVVGFAGVGIAGGLRLLDFGGEGAAHSGQVNKPRSCKASAMAKACASHGSRKTGPSASRGMPGTASVAWCAVARSITPARDMARTRRSKPSASDRHPGPTAPGLEYHRIEPLRIFAGVDRVRSGNTWQPWHARPCRLVRAHSAAGACALSGGCCSCARGRRP